MTNRRHWLCALTLLAVPLLRAEIPASGPKGIHARFTRQVGQAEKALPGLIQSAETSALRCLAGSNVLINVPYHAQPVFAEELLNRSGGLVNPLPT